MKGRKKDTEFVSRFISQCVQQGLNTPTEIVQAAKNKLTEIDFLILEANQAKQKRPQLLDVIASFETKKKDQVEDKSILSFYRLQYQNASQYWANFIQENGIISTHYIKEMSNDEKFAIKQMLAQDILTQAGGELVAGGKFAEYLEFLDRT